MHKAVRRVYLQNQKTSMYKAAVGVRFLLVAFGAMVLTPLPVVMDTAPFSAEAGTLILPNRILI